MSRQSFLCHDRNSSLSWSHAENFVATIKHLSQLTCVITLPFSVVIEFSFIATEFICYLQSLMLRQSKDCCDKVPLPFAFINVVTE